MISPCFRTGGTSGSAAGFATVVAGLVSLYGAAPAPPEDQPTYRITQYDLRVEPDFAAKTVRMLASIEISNPGLDKDFSFELADAYHIVSLRASGSEARAEHEKGEVNVELLRPQNKVVLTFELQASPGRSQDEERPVIDDHSLFLLWSDRWYPVDFDQWATVKTTVVLPSNFQVIAPGKVISARRHGDTIDHVFQTTQPTVSFSVFADSRWIRSERQMGGFRIVTLLHPESQKHAAQIFRTSADVLKFFADLHGCYAFDQFAFVTIPGMYARRAFAGWIGYSPEYLEKEMARTGYDAHETSLLWWGMTSHGRGPGSWQWTEGLGDYVEVMYGEARKKPLPQNFVRFRSEYLASPPEEDVPYVKLRGNTAQKVVHGKYPWTMQVMRDRIGDNAFRRGIRLLFDRYRFRTFSMEEFVSTFEETSRQSLSWWREQWLERQGVPAVAFESSVIPFGNRYRITCKLAQTAALYELPLEIGIRTANTTRIEKIVLRNRTAEVTFESDQRPSDVTLDPNDRILMKKLPQ
jgi:aminopeptidase N